MKYFVRCSNCGRVFAVNEVREGDYVFHCPSCNSVVRILLEARDDGLFPFVECMVQRVLVSDSSHQNVFVSFFRFLRWIWQKIQLFRSRYRNADLLLFFVGAILFLLFVFVGLYVCAKVTILLADAHSWLFRFYLKVKFFLS